MIINLNFVNKEINLVICYKDFEYTYTKKQFKIMCKIIQKIKQLNIKNYCIISL